MDTKSNKSFEKVIIIHLMKVILSMQSFVSVFDPLPSHATTAIAGDRINIKRI